MNTTPAEYTINVQNHSGQHQTYFLYPAAPLLTPSPENGGGKLHHCTQIAAPKVPSPKGSVMFSLNMKPYAITGTSSKPLGPGVKVDIRDSRRVRIATMNALGDVAETSRESNAWGAGFGELRSGCETLGSFSIKTDGELQESDDSKEIIFIGLGAPHPEYRNEVVPVACFTAPPGVNTVITPLAKYYVAFGEQKTGQIFDPSAVENPCEVDFMSRAATRAWVVHNEDGEWEMHYS